MKNAIKWTVVVGSTALLAGSCGLVAGGAAEVPESEVRTVEKRVEVPGPTEVKTETVTKEVEVVPQSCLEAINKAEEIASINADFAGTSSKFPPMVAEAYEAGIFGDNRLAQDIIDRLNKYEQDMNMQIDRMTPKVVAFNASKGECRRIAGVE